MKKLYLFIFTLVILFSCSDDDEKIFDSDPSEIEISFESFPGGAYMNYVLPSDIDIFYIQVKYKNFKDEEVVVRGSTTTDKLKLTGFVEEAKDIPLEISLLDKNMIASKTITKYFSTKISGVLGVFENLKVYSYWNGFQVKYNLEEDTDGFINIGFIGINPKTNVLDTILKEIRPLFAGENSYYYSNATDTTIKDMTVVVWTDDFKSNRIKKEIFEKIPIGRVKQFNCSDVDFEGSSIEKENLKQGKKYLFDGDTKGINAYVDPNFSSHCFRSEPRSVPGEWILDLKEEQELAFVRFYNFLNAKLPEFPPYEYCPPCRVKEQTSIPNRIKIYLSNDKENWIKSSEFYEPPSTYLEDRWYGPGCDFDTASKSRNELEEADPSYMNLNFDITGEKYRYIKIEVLETFPMFYDNRVDEGDGSFYTEEIEVFIKK